MVTARISGTPNDDSYINNGKGFAIGTTVPGADRLFNVVSTTKLSSPFPKMTGAQASLITAADGDGVYITATDATFTSVGFWGYENGAWIKL